MVLAGIFTATGGSAFPAHPAKSRDSKSPGMNAYLMKELSSADKKIGADTIPATEFPEGV
jgi:hypothetical protein